MRERVRGKKNQRWRYRERESTAAAIFTSHLKDSCNIDSDFYSYLLCMNIEHFSRSILIALHISSDKDRARSANVAGFALPFLDAKHK